jgi:hypothetical protein
MPPHHLDAELASTIRGLAAGQKITDRRGEQMLAGYSHLRIAVPSGQADCRW